jgi:hypothetical protein
MRQIVAGNPGGSAAEGELPIALASGVTPGGLGPGRGSLRGTSETSRVRRRWRLRGFEGLVLTVRRERREQDRLQRSPRRRATTVAREMWAESFMALLAAFPVRRSCSRHASGLQ